MKLKPFHRLYCSGSTTRIVDPIPFVHRKRDIHVFDASMMYVECLKTEIPIVAVGHPSHFGGEPVWGGKVVPSVRALVERFQIEAGRGD